jgi:hypothetical protein
MAMSFVLKKRALLNLIPEQPGAVTCITITARVVILSQAKESSQGA